MLLTFRFKSYDFYKTFFLGGGISFKGSESLRDVEHKEDLERTTCQSKKVKWLRMTQIAHPQSENAKLLGVQVSEATVSVVVYDDEVETLVVVIQ